MIGALYLFCCCTCLQLVLGADMGQRLRQVHSCMRCLMDSAAALLAYCSDTEAGRPYVQQVSGPDATPGSRNGNGCLCMLTTS
jgi:hypothetical protein